MASALHCFTSSKPSMNVSDIHRLKSLEDEKAKLKRLLADTMLDNVMYKDWVLIPSHFADRSTTCATASR